MKTFKVICVALSLLLIVSACSKDSKSSSKNESSFTPSIDFKKCEEFQCGTLEVPMDYKNVEGRKIDIAVLRRPAKDKKNRIGVILVNPGGPGASGIGMAKSAGVIFPQEILDKFDIIGWDPRGAGASTSVSCSKNLDFLFQGVDYSPDTQEEKDNLVAVNKEFGQKCEEEDAQLLPFLNTENSVRDMDEIRKALDEEKINYLGFSYGTSLGQIYATLFPKNFRAMVIDGVIDLGAEPKDTAVQQAVGFESSIDAFFEYCKEEGCTYAASGDPKTKYIELMQEIDANPIKSSEKNFSLGPAQLDIATANWLYSGEYGYQLLDEGLTDAQRGKPADLLGSFSSYVGRSLGGKYDGSYSAFLTIGCSDGYTANAQGMFDLATIATKDAEIFGETGILLGMPCATWPSNELAKPFEVDTSKDKPIVVIGTTGDPATPVQWARNAAKQIANSSYIEVRGTTHTSYGGGNNCVEEAVNNYFLELKNPGNLNC